MIEWESLLKINEDWILDRMLTVPYLRESKLTVRTYSLKFHGPQQRLDVFAEHLSDRIVDFAFTDKEKEKYEHPWKHAKSYFPRLPSWWFARVFKKRNRRLICKKRD